MKKVLFIIYKIVCISLTIALFLNFTGYTNPVHAAEQFQVLIDINQIYASEAEKAVKFAADGVWTIPYNSRNEEIDWSKTFNNLNANKWIVSEDNPGGTSQVDLVSKTIGRIVDGAMFYHENNENQIISDTEIEKYASHIVPGFGQIGNRIIVLTRKYNDTTSRENLNHALNNPHVAGAAFEFNPGGYYCSTTSDRYKFAAGCKYILNQGKKCYLLMPPNRPEEKYLERVKICINYFANANLLNNKNVYVVLPVYVRSQTKNVNFLSINSRDTNSIESVVKWLNEYRHISTPTPTVTPTPTATSTPLAGDINKDGKVNISDYNVFVGNFGKTGTVGFIPSDIIKNGKIDIFDYNVLVGNFGK